MIQISFDPSNYEANPLFRKKSRHVLAIDKCNNVFIKKVSEVSPARLNFLQSFYKKLPSQQNSCFPSVSCNFRGNNLTLRISPIGTELMPTSVGELKIAIKTIIIAVRLLHQAGYAHQDIRWANVLRRSPDPTSSHYQEWMLIDFESVCSLSDSSRRDDFYQCGLLLLFYMEWVLKDSYLDRLNYILFTHDPSRLEEDKLPVVDYDGEEMQSDLLQFEGNSQENL